MFTGLESPIHLIIILVIVLLLFGAKRIPELAKGLGTGIREFKKGTSGEADKDRLDEREREGELAGKAGDDRNRVRAQEETAREERTGERGEQGADKKRAEQNL